MGRRLRVVGLALLAALAMAPTAPAAPFRVTLPRASTGTVLDRLPSWTFAADQLPAGFVASPSSAVNMSVVLRHPSLVVVDVEASGVPDVFPIIRPQATIAPPGATVAADGSWTLAGETYQFGRFADGSGRKLWLTATIAILGGDVRSPTPEQAAAIAAVHAALEPSLRVWYGLDPRTTSDTNRARVIAAVSSAIHRAASLRSWSATVDEVGLAPRRDRKSVV